MTTLLTKLASGLLTFALVASFVPAAVFAQNFDLGVEDESTSTEITSEEVEISEENAQPGIITTPVLMIPGEVDGELFDGDVTFDESLDIVIEDSQEVVEQVNVETMSLQSFETLAVNDEGEFDTFNTGSVNGQGGWKVTGGYDQEIVDNTTGPSSFGLKALRISNAVTSGAFGDQIFSAPLANAVGENSATTGGFSEGTRGNHFEMSFDFASAIPNFEQPGLAVTLSPDRGDGSRMSYLKLADTPTGIDVIFYDVQGTSNPANFVETVVATGLDRAAAHNVRLTLDTYNGPSDDVVKVYINGDLVHTGTSWENYYRFDSEASAEQTPRIVNSVLFRMSGAAAAGTMGKGFLFDHVNVSSELVARETPTETSVVVRSEDLETETDRFLADQNNSGKWFFYNDENDTIDNLLSSFVTGPSNPLLGTGSAQISVTGTERRNLATYRFAGVDLADITKLAFTTYNPSAGNGATAGSNRSAYLQFNVSFNGVDDWQRRLTYVPAKNVTDPIAQDAWKTWDAIDSGNALWTYSGPTWPVTGGSGNTPKTWNQILKDYPNAQIRESDSYLGLRVGEPYANGYTENIDSFVFGTTESVTMFDFEDEAPVVIEEENTSSGRSGSSRRVTTTGTVAGASTGPVGQVLGASTYNFTANLSVGSTGADVNALQAMLIASGDLAIATPTGYFGPLTQAALAKWQAARGIVPASGYFGPLTQAAIAAAAVTPAMTDEARAALLVELLKQVADLQEQLNEMMADES